MSRHFLALICVAFTLSSSHAQQRSFTEQHSSTEQPSSTDQHSSTDQLRSSKDNRHSFTTNDTAFLLDGKPFQIISGEMHYPRIPRAAWRERMRMAKAMGINTIGTYAFWNLHEPEKGEFDFSDNNDIAEFVRTAQEEGLWVLLRPSPYVCAEWEFGGYPYWLQNIKGLIVRSKEPQYLREYQKYIDRLGKELSPLLVTNGGNILMVQVENEYGAYATDREYLEINRKMFVNAGFNCLLNTCDAAKDIEKGILPGLLPAINGNNAPEKVKTIINKINNGKGPYFMAEWYPAWFDWWGETHHTVPVEKYARQLDSILSAGISINMYMIHGGTTRGFMNGANCYDTSYYQPQVSSYDYDAPLDEAGNPTEKFMVFRSVIERHLPRGVLLPIMTAPKRPITLPPIVFKEEAPIVSILPKPRKATRPLSFEDLGQPYGYVLYRTKISSKIGGASTTSPTSANSTSASPISSTSTSSTTGTASGASGVLRLKDLRDYAIIFINGKRQGILNRMQKQDSLMITILGGSGDATLDILVENLGRINYGPNLLKNKKGITGMVSFNQQELKGWQMYSLPFDQIDSIRFPGTSASTETSGSPQNSEPTEITSSPNSAESSEMPIVKRATFQLTTPGDTYLDMRAWGKGCVWVNGHNLGRYWEIGPQQTIYVPAEWLNKGYNVIEILELLKPSQNELNSVQKPILSQLRPETQ